ncbi:MAG: asparagine synthase (glutamine-hydrolyzing) [Chloroflexota bacterium]
MCGICGFINEDGAPANQAFLQIMADSIRHRGPDDDGYFTQGPVGLGMRRLSIIDLAGGHQPIANEDDTIWIVFNGEMYNFPELRSQLESAGHRFRTHTDTEVVIHAYEEWGLDALKRFNGMYAFALWDGGRRQLVLARDHVGIKPLYYGLQNGVFLFGSELKALMQHPAADRDLDLHALDQFLTYMYVPTPYSILQGIQKLPPGHTLVWRDGQTELHQYWDVHLDPSDRERLSEDEAERLVLDAVRESVRKELIADVPVGVLLSGGVDSSAVAAFMKQFMPGGLDSFSISFDDPSFDESRFARLVAHHLGTRHHELTVTANMMLDVVPDIMNVLDEPMADASVIPSYVLSRFARQHVKVALGGDGGDELFAGYSTFQAHRLAEYYRLLPSVVRQKLVPAIVNKLPVSHNNLSFDFKAKRFISAADLSPAIRHHRWMGCFSADERRLLLHPDLHAELDGYDPFSVLDPYIERAPTRSPIDQVLYLDMKMYMEADILVKVDRSSMGCSLETRVPLLNRTLIETVERLPLDMKLRGFSRKYIFRKALKGILPPEIIDRSKKGFGIPMARWINSELAPLVNELFDEQRIRSDGYFQYAYIRSMLDDHTAGRRDNRMQLWTLMVFQLWHQRYMSARAPLAAMRTG